MKNKLFNKKMLMSVIVIIVVSELIISGFLLLFKANAAIQTESAAIKPVSSDIQSDGTVTAQNQATLHFQIGGEVVSVPVKEGDTIKQGQTIAVLDSSTLQKQLAQALNAYQISRDTFDQTQANGSNNILQTAQKSTVTGAGLSGDNAQNTINDIVKRLADQSQASLNNSVLNVEIATQALRLATLSSPINGVITHMDVTTPYVNVTPLTSITVADPTSLVFRSYVSENDIDFVSEGSLVTIKLGSNDERQYSGTVNRIYPDKVSLVTGQKAYQVDIESNDLAQNGRMGESGVALIQSNAQTSAKLVPTWTVLNHDSVWVLSNGQPVLRKVTVGKVHGDMTEIITGIMDDDQVILNPESIASRSYQIL